MSRLARWVWTDPAPAARCSRAALLPAALAYRGLSRLHALAQQRVQPRTLPGPTIALGNLSVGGTGKTPLASWLARYCLGRGVVPGILLRGYGADEGQVHRRLVPGAVVVEHPDRARGAEQAAAAGARVFILDDAFQRRDVRRDLNLLLLSAESARHSQWLLPAGPWREPRAAARRADLIIVTRKQASRSQARRLGQQAARFTPGRPVVRAALVVAGFSGLDSGRPVAAGAVAGQAVLCSAGIADPEGLSSQIEGLGARVRRLDWPDHHRYSDRDIERIVVAAGPEARVVVTEKDAGKLRGRWPAHVPEPLVAALEVRWESGEAELRAAIHQVISSTMSGCGHMERT